MWAMAQLPSAADAIDTTPWSGLELVRPTSTGNRNDVWFGRFRGTAVAVRRSGRSGESLDWELDMLDRLVDAGFLADHPQRPGCSTALQLEVTRRSVDADIDAMPPELAGLVAGVFNEFADVSCALIHGDPTADNIRIGSDGSVGLLDWDESRVDLTWHDLSNLGVQVLDDDDHRRAERLSNAREAVNGWTLEPEYARRRLRQLRQH